MQSLGYNFFILWKNNTPFLWSLVFYNLNQSIYFANWRDEKRLDGFRHKVEYSLEHMFWIVIVNHRVIKHGQLVDIFIRYIPWK